MSDPNSGRPSLENLLDDVQRTRGVLRDLLDTGRPGTAGQVVEAREQARAALEGFVALLGVRQLPVPRQINDELQLMRRLCGQPWSPTGAAGRGRAS